MSHGSRLASAYEEIGGQVAVLRNAKATTMHKWMFRLSFTLAGMHTPARSAAGGLGCFVVPSTSGDSDSAPPVDLLGYPWCWLNMLPPN